MALPILDGNQSAATLSTIITGGAHIPAHTVVSLGSQAISDITSGVSGSVVSVSNFPASQSTTFGAVTGSVSVLNFPSTQAIAGTVTANVQLLAANTGYNEQNGSAAFGISGADVNAIRTVIYSSANSTFGGDAGAPVDSSNPLPITGNISGTVTANAFGYDLPNANVAQIPVHNYDEGFSAGIKAVPALIGNEFGGFNNSNPLPISGTVTANNPSGALTTRFGSVTTANTAQITSAVTNTNRKYLLAQNISAGTVTIGIGFSPTTTQGIQLTAGAGLTFDAFCPTGAVYWLGAVTGAAYTILEG